MIAGCRLPFIVNCTLALGVPVKSITVFPPEQTVGIAVEIDAVGAPTTVISTVPVTA
ncbi:hypothetical protein D3C80_833250 [compost metagenome]